MNNKYSSLKILYIFRLGFFYLIYNYIIPIGSGMAIYSAGVFMFICLGHYLSDNLKFDIPHYRVNKFFVTMFINLFFFLMWLILTWDFWIIPMMQEETYKIDVELISNEWLLYGYGFKILHSPVQNRIKRIFDISMAVVIGILTSPIMVIAAIIVRLESPGPIIYSQARVGEQL